MDPSLTIVPNKLYYWRDHMPNLSLDQYSDLSMADKRQTLFGRNTIEDVLTDEHNNSRLMFSNYINLDFRRRDIHKIFLPVSFLSMCHNYPLNYSRDLQRFDNKYVSFTCPMYKSRYARILASAWMANHRDKFNFVYTQSWHGNEQIELLYELLQIGGLKDSSGSQGPRLDMLPKLSFGNADHSLYGNFGILYENFYRPAAACVIIGAIFWEHGGEICEKYLNALYSGCIPLLAGYRVYDSLEAMGFDTFKDVIDTSSQYELNPVQAVWGLFDRNRKFFNRSIEIIQDPAIQQRLVRNLDLALDIKRLFNNAITGLNSPNDVGFFNSHKSQVWDYFSHHNPDLSNLHDLLDL